MVGFLALEEIWICNLSIMAWKPFFAYPNSAPDRRLHSIVFPNEIMTNFTPGEDFLLTEKMIDKNSVGRNVFPGLFIRYGMDVRISSWHPCHMCWWEQQVKREFEGDNPRESFDWRVDHSKKFPIQTIIKDFAKMLDEPSQGTHFDSLIEVAAKLGHVPVLKKGVGITFNIPAEDIRQLWDNWEKKRIADRAVVTSSYKSFLACDIGEAEPKVIGHWHWSYRLRYEAEGVVNESTNPTWNNAE